MGHPKIEVQQELGMLSPETDPVISAKAKHNLLFQDNQELSLRYFSLFSIEARQL